MAFTTAMQVERLWQVAEKRKLREPLDAAIPSLVLAAVGPVVAAALAAKGHTPSVVPSPQFFMRRLTDALVNAFKPA